MITTDVLIKGDGPAGLAAAITLKQKGKLVTVVQRKSGLHTNTRVGESLSSSALISLKELNLINEFLQSEHHPCYGNSSSWGNNKLCYFDFIQSPMGHGWYIDRLKFNNMLLSKAKSMGVTFIIDNRTASLKKNSDDSWNYTMDNHMAAINTRIIIDASGRHSWLSRHLGIKRINDDKQIAVINIFNSKLNNKSSHSMIEAVKDGWWYLSDFEKNKTACIYFTDVGLHKLADLTDPNYLKFKKNQTIFIKHRIPDNAEQLINKPEITSSCSSNLSQYSGPGWFAAGDAACAMDPLSSHGITFALRSGIDAGSAASSVLEGLQNENAAYNDNLQHAIQSYRKQKTEIYKKENRWVEYPYWKSRHSDALL